ncbi:MAG TPA: SRPBCC family protein [Polyangiales bacterium]
MTNRVAVLFSFFTALLASTVQAQTIETEIVNEVVIDRPIDEVFEYASTAANWAEWHPNTLFTVGEDDHSATVGEKIVEVIKAGPIPAGRLFWTVTAHDVPTRWQLKGESEDASMHFLLTYTMSSTEDGGTLFRRTLNWETKKNPFTTLFQDLAKSLMELISQQAVEQLKEAVESQP